jgi:starch phosphorylase
MVAAPFHLNENMTNTEMLMAHILPERIQGLAQLAHNLWWSWHPEARRLFKVLDRTLWKKTGHNPVEMLNRIAPQSLVAALRNGTFLEKYDQIMDEFASDMAGDWTWLRTTHPELSQQTIAYFSMEFAIHNSLPLYAGGLGVLAGDFCKEASDLGLPVVGVGFMYPQGYFHQRMNDDGWQEEVYRQLDFAHAPVSPVLSDGRLPLKLKIELDSRSVWIRVWRVNVGRVTLYLLDTDLEDNSPSDRALTARLYAGDQETRLQQEVVLGIGGVRVLRAIGISPSVWHSNEGPVTFMALERCREMVQNGARFHEALRQVKATTVFTTHTPVPAGNDSFSKGLVRKYFNRYWDGLGLDEEAFMRLGSPDPDHGTFGMTVLGLRMADHCNGVSQLHGAVCRRMWHCLWPEREEHDVPITSITNGIHVPSWIAPQMAGLYEKYLGAGWLNRQDDPGQWDRIDSIPDEEIWEMHRWLKQKLVSYVRDQARRRLRENHCSPAHTLAMGAMLDPDALTLVFSRRFTDYKRGALIMRDRERLKRIVQSELRPVQIIYSGKAHPNDHHGKELIQEVYNASRDTGFDGRIAFVENYDMHVARYFVQGADVWLNTPRLFNEASGTSGMKAALNGVLHLSILDGWWHEAYDGSNGWAIKDDLAFPGEDADARDAGQLYHLLEEEVVPLYYRRDLDGVPHDWIRMVKRSLRTIAPVFSARRMVKEYTESLYLPATRAPAGTLV